MTLAIINGKLNVQEVNRLRRECHCYTFSPSRPLSLPFTLQNRDSETLTSAHHLIVDCFGGQFHPKECAIKRHKRSIKLVTTVECILFFPLSSCLGVSISRKTVSRKLSFCFTLLDAKQKNCDTANSTMNQSFFFFKQVKPQDDNVHCRT